MYKLGGVKGIGWIASGGALGSATDLGRIKNDSTHSPETATEEDSQGLEIFAGEDDVYEINCYDISKYAALRTKSIDDDNIVDIRITYLDDSTEDKLGYSVIVSQPTNFAAKTRNYFKIRLKRVVIA
jgi:hypothetical protein